MSESTDETLSHVCENCGNRFYLRHYVNQYGGAKIGKPTPAKFCSPACRLVAFRARKRAETHPTHADVPSGSVSGSVEPPAASLAPLKRDLHPDAFERLREGKQLSNWKPSGDGKDVPPIPDFLRRT